jgi:hypothetical protein
MTTSTKTTGLAIKTSVKAGGLTAGNHSRVLKVRSNVKAGGVNQANHSRVLVSAR